MGEKGLQQALDKAEEALPEGYHIEVVPDPNGVPRPIGVPNDRHFEVGPDGKPDRSKPVEPHLRWDEEFGTWMAV